MILKRMRDAHFCYKIGAKDNPKYLRESMSEFGWNVLEYQDTFKCTRRQKSTATE